MPQVTRLRVVGAAIAAGALTLGTLVTATAAQAANPRKAIADTHPRGPSPRSVCQQGRYGRHRQRAGVPGPQPSRLSWPVTSPPSPARPARATATSGPPRQVRKEFAPSAAEVASVKSWLTWAGLSVTRISAQSPAGAYIGVRGSVAAASKAFGVTFGTYRGPGGQSARAPQQAATAPSSVASSVLAVSGLDTAKSAIKPALPPPGPNYWVAKPCSTYYGRRPRPTSPRRTASSSPGTTAATSRARCAAPTG